MCLEIEIVICCCQKRFFNSFESIEFFFQIFGNEKKLKDNEKKEINGFYLNKIWKKTQNKLFVPTKKRWAFKILEIEMSLIPRFDCKWNYQLVVVVEKLLYSFESIEFFQRWAFKIFGNWNVLNTMFWCDCKMKVSISRCWKRFSIHLIQLSFFFFWK